MQIETCSPLLSYHSISIHWKEWCGSWSVIALMLLLSSTTVMAAQNPQKANDQQQPIDLTGDWDGITIKQAGQSVLAYAGSKEIFHGNLTGQKLVGEFVLPTTEHGKKCTGADELWWEAKLTISQNGNTQTIRGDQFKNWRSDRETCGNIQYFWDTLPAVFTKTKVFQVIDPACSTPTICNGDFLKNTGGVVSLDETKLLKSTVERSGVVTDGVTQLLLRVKGSESVTFTLSPNLCGFGTLSKLDGSSSCGSLTVEPTKIGEESYVFAIYQAPLNLPENAIVSLEAKNSAGVVIDTKILQLRLPPVMLVHGLWDNSSSWNKVFTPVLNEAGYNVHLVDHNSGRYPATGPFDPLATCKDPETPSCLVNSAIPKFISETKKAIGDIREKGIAATQVDVVAHSLGGLIARATVKTTYDDYKYKRTDNYQKGDFHKIITIGTPHQGTRLADILVNGKCRARKICKPLLLIPPDKGGVVAYAACELVTQRETLETTLSRIGHRLGPAVYGLQTASSSIKNIGDTPVPSHAIVGIAPNISVLEILFNSLISFYKVVTMEEGFTTIDNILGGNTNHDSLVPAESQRGGLTDSAVTTFQNVDHLGEVGGLGRHAIIPIMLGIKFIPVELNKVAPDIANRVVKLLREPPDSPSFGYFSALSGSAGKSNREFEKDINACEDGTLRMAERARNSDSAFSLRKNRSQTAMTGSCDGDAGEICTPPSYSNAVITFEPMPKTRVTPGQTIQIRLDIANGSPQEGAIISIGNSLQVVEGSPPYFFDYTVPKDSAGKIDISVQTISSDLEAETYLVESNIIANLPSLGIGYAAKDGVIQASPSANFSGGISTGYGEFLRENTITTEQEVEIRGSLVPQTEHVTKKAEILAVTFFLKEDFLKVDGTSSENCNPALADSANKGGYYMTEWKRNNEYLLDFNFSSWDGNLDNLSHLYSFPFSLDFQSDIQPLESGVFLYKGRFESGHACIYFGYRVPDGTVVFNGEHTINIRIKP